MNFSSLPAALTVTTSTANAASGILGGGVFVANNDFATITTTGNKVAAYIGYTQFPTAGTGAVATSVYDDHTTLFAAVNTAVVGPKTIGGLVFNKAGAGVFTLSSGVLTINDGTGVGGIIVSSTVGANLSTLQGAAGTSITAPSELIIQNNSGSGFNVTATISDGGAGTIVTVGGIGTTSFTAVNTYAGGTYINGGTLAIALDTALGAIPGSATSNITFSGNSQLKFNAATTLNVNRNVFIASGVVATLNATAASTVAGIISGPGGVTISNTSNIALVLSGQNQYTGGTTITSGTLAITNDLSFGAVPTYSLSPSITMAANTSLSFTSSATISANRTITLASGTETIFAGTSSGTIAGSIQGAGGLFKAGTNSLFLTGSNSYTGGTTISLGILNISSDAALGAVPGSPTTNLSFTGVTGSLTFLAPTTLNANRLISISNTTTTGATFSGAVPFTIAGNISGIAGTPLGVAGFAGSSLMYVGGTLTNLNGLAMSGTGVLTLAQGYAGGGAAGTVTVSAGTLIAVNSISQSGTTPLVLGTAAFQSQTTSAQTFVSLSLTGNATVTSSSNMTFGFINGGGTTRALTLSSGSGSAVTFAPTTSIGNAAAAVNITLLPNTVLSFANNGTISTGLTSTITAAGGTLTFDNSGTDAQRFTANVNLALAAGTLSFTPGTTGSTNDTLGFGSISLLAGSSALSFNGANTGTVSATSFVRSVGATMNITNSGTLGTNQIVLLGGVTSGFLGGTVFSNGPNFATYDATIGVQSLSAGQYTTINGAPLTGAVNGIYDVTGNATVAGTTSLSGLRITSGMTVASGGTLSFTGLGISSSITNNAGGIIATGGGTSSINSTIAWANAGQDLTIRVNAATDTLDVATLSGGTNSITKDGLGTLRLTLDSSASFTGGVYLNGGSLRLASSVTTTLGFVQAGALGGATSTLSIGNTASLTIGTYGGYMNTVLGTNSALMVGNGGAFNGTVTGSFTAGATGTGSFIKSGTGTETYAGAINMTNSTTGLVRVDGGTLALNAAISSSGISNAAIILNPGGSLTLLNAASASTLTNDQLIFQGGALNYITAATASGTWALSNAALTNDFSTSSLALTQSNATAAVTLTAPSLAQSNLGFLVVSAGTGTVLGGGSAAGSLNLTLGSTPTLYGGLNNAYNANPVLGEQAIIPNAVVSIGGKHTFATYDPTFGLRAATASGETATVLTNADLANISSAAPYSNVILSQTSAITLAGNTVVNALEFNGAAAFTLSMANNGTANTLTVASGLIISNEPAGFQTLSGGMLTFGNGNQTVFNGKTVNLGTIDVLSGTQLLNSSTTIADAGTTSVAIAKIGAGTFFAQFNATTNNSYTGGTIIEQGTVVAASLSGALGTGGVTFWGSSPALAISGNLTVPYITTVAPVGIPNVGTTFTTGGIFTRGIGAMSLTLGGARDFHHVRRQHSGNVRYAAEREHQLQLATHHVDVDGDGQYVLGRVDVDQRHFVGRQRSIGHNYLARYWHGDLRRWHATYR